MTNPKIRTADLLSIADLSRAEIESIFEVARAGKADPAAFAGVLAGKAVVLLFEKESLRTKVSFEIGVSRLGGLAVYHDHRDARIGERESVSDYARNLERWCDCIVARVYGHSVLAEMSAASRVPIVNALSDLEHPCQALADLLTLTEKLGTVEGIRVAYVGDGNNVCQSLMLACATMGASCTAICPKGLGPDEAIVRKAAAIGERCGATISVTDDLGAVAGHDAVYTDTWVSMGHEAEAARRHVALARYQVTQELMDRAGRDALFMHCLPAHRGFEVAPEVIDSPRSIVFDQAENRLHAQNAVLVHLLGGAR
jgi:ornithine carbamoyltransferase